MAVVIKKDIISFVREQDGNSEREFKNKITKQFIKLGMKVRAYLAQLKYGGGTNFNVAICLKIHDSDNAQDFVFESENIFKSIFSGNENIDILFLTDKQEIIIRKICTPFYTSSNFQIQHPDFYLTSYEGYNLNDTTRSCYKRKRLYGSHPDGYVLCDVNPSIVGQPFGLSAQDINQLILTSRYKGSSLFPITKWPFYVNVARPLISNIENKIFLEKSDIELIGLAELHEKINL